MKKFLALLLVLSMVFTLCACGKKTDDSKYTGKLVVYSPHDADPLNAGVAQFKEKYPNIDVEVIAAGTGELCQRIVAEAENPQGDVLWGGGADTLAAYNDYFQPYVAPTTSSSAMPTRMPTATGSVSPPCPWSLSTTRPCWTRPTSPPPGKACATRT